MTLWGSASLVYFAYVAVVGLTLPRLRTVARIRAVAGAVIGSMLAASAGWTSAFWVRDVIVPPLVLLVSYWSSGFLWTGTMERIERWLVRSDAALGVTALASRLPRTLVELLEFAYVGVYPLVPIAFGLYVVFHPSPDTEYFWAVVLITDFICFAMLPWIQTRPPRALEVDHPWGSHVRGFNLKLMGSLSNGVNTVPSGHAAEALAIALLMMEAPAPVSPAMWLSAAAISAGAVFGRYHYAIDIAAGWGVAVLVWLVLPA